MVVMRSSGAGTKFVAGAQPVNTFIVDGFLTGAGKTAGHGRRVSRAFSGKEGRGPVGSPRCGQHDGTVSQPGEPVFRFENATNQKLTEPFPMILNPVDWF